VLPVQKPMPPVWIGANIDVGIRRAARMADAWFVNPHNKLATIAQQIEVYKRALDACGKPFPSEFPMAREVFIARTRAEAIERARPSLEAKYKAYRDWGQDKVMPSSDHFDLDFDELVDDRFLIGSPAEVAEQVLELRRRFGVTTLIAGVHWVGMPKSLAIEQFPTLYRANTLSSIRKVMISAGFVLKEIETINHYPAYLMFSPILFRLGVLYERLTSLDVFQSLRGSILCVFEKPATSGISSSGALNQESEPLGSAAIQV